MYKWLHSRAVILLLWSEKYTKTDMIYLAHGGFFSLAGQGVGLFAALLLAAAVSHFLPREIYGIYKYTVSFVTILSLFSLNGLSVAVFQSAAQNFDGALKTGFWLNIRWSILVFAGALCFGSYYLLNGNSTLGIGILIGGSLSPFIASANLFSPFLSGKKDFYHQALYGILDNVIPILILILAVIATHNAILIIATYFITNVLAGLFFYHRTRILYQAGMHRDDESLLGYSKHLSAMGIISGIAMNIDQILLFHFVGPAQLAIYNFAVAIPEQMKGPVKNLNSMLQARFATRSNTEIRRDMHNKFFWYFVASVIATMSYILLAPYVFRFLFPTYMDAVWYSQVYAIWILCIAFDPASIFLTAKRRTRELYASNIIYSVLQISFLIGGILTAGLIGVIIARVSLRIIMGPINYVLYRRAIDSETAAAH